MTREYVLDLAERSLGTFLGAGVTVLAADVTDLVNLAVWQQAATAGGSAVAVLLLGLLAKLAGPNKESASVRK